MGVDDTALHSDGHIYYTLFPSVFGLIGLWRPHSLSFRIFNSYIPTPSRDSTQRA